MKYDIKVICAGTINADEMFHFYGQKPGHWIDSPSYYYILDNGADKIMVDTGFDHKEIVESFFPQTVKADVSFTALLKKAGTKPEEIKTIVFTHLHWDHMGYLRKFPHAKFYVQKSEFECAFDTGAVTEDYKAFFSEYLWPYKDQFIWIDGDKEIFAGIKALWTGGHSKGSQCILVETEAGIVALPGDVIARYRNYEEDIPAGSVVNLNEAIAAIAKIKKAADIILPSHDFLVEKHWNVIK